jgi:copper chaperone CopZ
VLDGAINAALNKHGGCATDIDNQLKTIDVFTLTVESIPKLSGSTATALVQTTVEGKKVKSTVTLTHEKAGWRIASLGAF